MTKEDLESMEKTYALGIRNNKDSKIWKIAFDEYNKENRYKLSMDCSFCYRTVFKFHSQKSNQSQ